MTTCETGAKSLFCIGQTRYPTLCYNLFIENTSKDTPQGPPEVGQGMGGVDCFRSKSGGGFGVELASCAKCTCKGSSMVGKSQMFVSQ